MQNPSSKDDNLLENLEKAATISVIPVDVAPLVSPRGDVVNRSRKLDSELAGHQQAGAKPSVEQRGV